jgi:class 3 adenylate cyclase
MATRSQSATVTILFTDLVNSTQLLQELGEEKAQPVFAAHHSVLNELVTANHGTELEWLGDGIVASFTSAADAVRSALAMQRAMRRATGRRRLPIRIGLATGEVMRREGGYFGETVVVARRLCDLANSGQVLCTALIASLLSGRQGFAFLDKREVALKGIAKPVAVCEVVARASATAPGEQPTVAAPATQKRKLWQTRQQLLLSAVALLTAVGVLAVVLLLLDGDGDGSPAAVGSSDPSSPARTVVQIYPLAEREGGYEALGWGSGVVVHPSGLILTSYSIVDGHTYAEPYDKLGIGLVEAEGERSSPAFSAQLVSVDTATDLAILQVSEDSEGNALGRGSTNLPSAEIAPAAPGEGDTLQLIGFPGSGRSTSNPAPGALSTSARVDAFDARSAEVETTVSSFKETFVPGRQSFIEILTPEALSRGQTGGGAFDSAGRLVGLLYPTEFGQDETLDQEQGHVRPISLANGRVEQALAAIERGEFACQGCPPESSIARDDSIVDIDPQSLQVTTSDYVVALDVDEDGEPVDVVDTVPFGVEQFYVFFDYSGMVDGIGFFWGCFAGDIQDNFGQQSETIPPAWTLGPEGRAFITCSTTGVTIGGRSYDGRPLPAGDYNVVLNISSRAVPATSGFEDVVLVGSLRVTVD